MPDPHAALTDTDRAEILALTSRYAHALDRHTWGKLELVFAPDATMEFAGLPPETGPAAIAATCARALEPLDASQHLVGSVLLETAGDSVTVSSYFHAQHVRTVDGRAALFTVAGTYDDLVERRPEGWRISFRRQSVSWQAGDPRILA
ncbi:nuclear transport factor 2 family protein [Dietzia sp. NPDC055340]